MQTEFNYQKKNEWSTLAYTYTQNKAEVNYYGHDTGNRGNNFHTGS